MQQENVSSSSEQMVAMSEKAEEERIVLQAQRDEVDAEISNLVGMEDVKKWFDQIRGKIRFVENGGPKELLGNENMNMVLTGNPGVGKTTLARLVRTDVKPLCSKKHAGASCFNP